jgi:leader peptidase (prepilin peptidase) / N-methyltransferase
MNALAHLATASGLPAGLLLAGVSLLGLLLGSFLNVVVWRLPRGESLAWPGSHCPACGHAVRPRDNVPLLGWLLLRGRCRDCAAPIGLRYPLVELAGGLAALAAALAFPGPAAAGAALLLLLALVAVFLIDLDHRLILDVVTLPGVALGLLLCPLLGTARLDALLGAAGGWLVLEGVRLGYRRWRGIDGLGGGDVKLAAMLGAWLGWQGVLLTFLLGSFVGAIIGLTMASRGRAGRLTALPYGVFLAPAAAVAVFWGRAAWTWYLSL